jgi:hypothetical protein
MDTGALIVAVASPSADLPGSRAGALRRLLALTCAGER